MSVKPHLHVHLPVPSYFICPISLELMRDPVTLSSGQTFDRQSIEKWLDDGHHTCPVTRHPIDPELELDPIPNHVLRRMIQSWCEQNQSLGIQRIVTPRQPPTAREIPALIDAICDRSSDPADSIQKLSKLLLDRPRYRRQMIQSGLLTQLGKFLSKSCSSTSVLLSSSAILGTGITPWSNVAAIDQALRLLDLLTQDEENVDAADELVVSLASMAIRARPETRQVLIRIVARMNWTDTTRRKVGGMQGFMESLVEVIKDASSCGVKSTGLKLILELCKSCNKNRVLAVEAQVVAVVVELLKCGSSGSLDKVAMELALRIVEVVCHCAEGRAATSSHVELVVKHMSGVSEQSSYLAVHILWLLIKSSPDSDKVKSDAYKHKALVKAVAITQSAASLETRLAARNISTSLLHRMQLPPNMPHTIRL